MPSASALRLPSATRPLRQDQLLTADPAVVCPTEPNVGANVGANGGSPAAPAGAMPVFYVVDEPDLSLQGLRHLH